MEVARELEADLLEDLPVAPGDGVAGALECIERSVQLSCQTPEARVRLKEPPPQHPPPERHDRMEKLAAVPEPAPEVREQVLAADRATGLPRRPRREGAPVRAFAGASRDGRGEA